MPFRTVLILFAALFLVSNTFSETGIKPEKEYRENGVVVIKPNKSGGGVQISEDDYLPGRIYLKLKPKINKIVKESSVLQASGGRRFGADEIDGILSKYGAENIEQAFKLRKELPKKVMNRIQGGLESLPNLKAIYEIEIRAPYSAEAAVADLNSSPLVEYAERVPADYPLAVPDDERWEDLQHLPQIFAEAAWDIHKGENGQEPVLLGICDTGVDWNHEDLNENVYHNLGEDADGDGTVLEYVDTLGKWVFDPGDENGIDDDGNGYIDDFIGWHFMADFETKEQDNDPKDNSNHGTHVAGIAAGVTNNEIGISSISWNLKFLTAATTPPGKKGIYNGYDAIVYLAENGADIINCSWGGGTYSHTANEAIQYSLGLGSIIIASSGNDNISTPIYPSLYPGVVGVASIASTDKKAYYSSFGAGVELSAPGGDTRVDGGILSTTPNGNYQKFQGTSMAGPFAAGVFALLKSYEPGFTNDEIIRRILANLDDIDTANPGFINDLGYGKVNAYKALTGKASQLPERLSLELIRVTAHDKNSDGDNAFEPGEEISIGMVLRNYSPYITGENILFTISSEDPDVEILQENYTGQVGPDGFTEIEGAFRVRIKEGVFSKFIDMGLKITSDDFEIAHGDTSSFQIPVNAGGILVWEPWKNYRPFSGSMINSFLYDRGYRTLYTSNLPPTLSGYDAVFLSFGSHSDAAGAKGMDPWIAEVVEDYLKRGGKLYLESGEALGFNQSDNVELLALMGVDSSDDGDEKRYIDTLKGGENSIMNGLQFVRSKLQFYSIDRIYPAEGAFMAFEETGYGGVGIQYEGEFGQKVFSFTYPVSELYDHNNPNNRYEFIKRVMDYFEIPMEYTVPEFSYSPDRGHPPLKVDFKDKSYFSIPITAWLWDFDNDGITDTDEQNPSYTFESPGAKTIGLTIENGVGSHSVSHSLSVFAGESAQDNVSTSYKSTVSPSENINLSGAFTFEAWINPKGMGGQGRGTILDKNKYILRIADWKKLELIFETEDDTKGQYVTNARNIEFNRWNHVAASYDGVSGVKLYINGVEEELQEKSGPPDGMIDDNSEDMLIIGNSADSKRGFYGRMDELRIWKKALSQEEIKENMMGELSPGLQGLSAYWQFEEGAGDYSISLVDDKDTAIFNSAWGEGWLPGYFQEQPVSIEWCEGERAMLFVTITPGIDSAEFQWKKGNFTIMDYDSSKYEGGKNDTLYINELALDDIGSYYVEADIYLDGDKKKGINSEKTRVEVTAPPEIVSFETNSETFYEYEPLEFKAGVIGSKPLKYQWYKDFYPVYGATDSVLIIEMPVPEDEGIYYCEVSNSCGVDKTDNFELKLLPSSVEAGPEGLFGLKAFPNPFKGPVEIRLNLAEYEYCQIALFDNTGRKLAELAEGGYGAGAHELNFDLSDIALPAGVYYIALKYGERTKSVKIIKE